MTVIAHKGLIKKTIASLVIFAVLSLSLLSDCAFADMIDAVRDGKLQIVKYYFDSDSSWRFYKSGYGWTLLHYAAHNLQTDVAEYLLMTGADVNARTVGNETPLSLAVQKAERESSGILGVLGIDIPRRRKMIDLLVVHGAKINSLNESIALDRVGAFSALLKKDPKAINCDNIYKSALNSSACWGSAGIMSFLLKNRNPVRTGVDLETLLETASRLGYKDIVKLLISSGADVNSNSDRVYTPLFNAIVFGNGRLFAPYYDPRSKLYQGADMKVQFCKPEDYIDIVKMLIAAGADVNTKPARTSSNENPMKSTFPLQIAAIKGWTEMAELLLSAGARSVINERDDVYHYTPLHHAADQGNKALVEVLLKNGADAAIKDDQNRIALKIAEEKGHKEIVEMLRRPGANE